MRRFNPDSTIIGFFGGIEELNPIPSSLRDAFDNVYVIPSEDPYWKWKNADLCVRQWFKDTGYKYSFDHIHLGEWDMLTLTNLDEIPLERGQNAMTQCFDYTEAMKIGWDWIEDGNEEWQEIKRYVSNQLDFSDVQSCTFGVMGGSYLCREYLEKFADIYPPSYSNDEVRIGLFSRAWNIDVIDNGFKDLALQNYHTADERRYHHFDEAYLYEGLEKGAKVLHPVRHKLYLD